MKMTDLEIREAFDKWYGIKPKGWFEAIRYNTAWRAWQAAKTQAIPDGFVVVPKVATKQMVNAGYEAHDGFFTNGAVQDVYVAMIEAAQEPTND